MTTDNEALALCGHEIGHISMNYWRKESLHDFRITVADGSGAVQRRCGYLDITELMVKIAGPLAQCLFLGVVPQKAIRFVDEYKDPNSDSNKMRELVRRFCNGVDSRKFQFDIQERTRSIMQHPATWQAINDAAIVLYRAGSMTGEQVQELFTAHHAPTMFDAPPLLQWVIDQNTELTQRVYEIEAASGYKSTV